METAEESASEEPIEVAVRCDEWMGVRKRNGDSNTLDMVESKKEGSKKIPVRFQLCEQVEEPGIFGRVQNKK